MADHLLSRRHCVERLLKIFSFVIIFLCACGGSARAGPERPIEYPDSITVQWENDFIANTDRDYTNGLRIGWARHLLSPGEKASAGSPLNSPWLTWLPPLRDPRADVGMTLLVGQSIFTPQDTKSTELIPNDRPYAAYLYAGVGLFGYRPNRLTLVELTLGVVGPWALGEEMQNSVHTVIASNVAQGWGYQLHNEPGLTLSYETRWRLWQRRTGTGWGMEVLPFAAGRLGNIVTDATFGAEVRFGWHLPAYLGNCPIRPGCDSNHLADFGAAARPSFGMHIFAGAQGSLVLRDIFLDGNTFRSSHHVDKEPLVMQAFAGFGLRYRRFRLSYCYIWSSWQFEEQARSQVYGSLTFSFDY